MRNGIRTIARLKEKMTLSPIEERELAKVVRCHPMLIPDYYLSLMDPNDKNDPIRRMVVPSCGELSNEGLLDSSGERENTKFHGLQHKYDSTVLLLSTNECAAYCRHCFRKRFVGYTDDEVLREFRQAEDYITRHPEVNNVLISGGDPMVLGTDVIQVFLEGLLRIPHVNVVRFGTRLPVVDPDRISRNGELLRLLRTYGERGLAINFVLHVNHPRELTASFRRCVDRLSAARVVLSNQAVLLKGVNDDPQVLTRLMNGLVSAGVTPYYLFQCRPVKKVKHHFQVPLDRAYRIVEEAKEGLSGLGKRFRFIMSHVTGKIEIIAVVGNDIFLKYHQAKDARDTGRFFRRRLQPGAGWLDDLADPEGEGSRKVERSVRAYWHRYQRAMRPSRYWKKTKGL